MKSTKPNKGLINEINDMREMMRNLENRSSTSRLLTEQTGCNFGNGGCHPDCTCITIGFPAYNQTMMDLDTDCCCGNEVPTIDGCQPGPCMDHTDCNVGQHCCYADSGMMSMGYPSCNDFLDCYDYPSYVSDAPGLVTGCMVSEALNYDPLANFSDNECCYDNNSGCMNPSYINGDDSFNCDCNNAWQVIGYGNVGCCLVPLQGGGNNNPSLGGGVTPGTPFGYITLDDLSSLPQNPNCFIGETLITMEDESNKRIDEVKVGDIVKSEINTSTIISIDVHNEKEYVVYSLNNSKAFVTEEHPFKTTIGWKSINPVETFKKHGVESNVLEVGDVLITKEGTEELRSIDKSSTTVNVVYNLRLDNELVYYADGFLVHNAKNAIDNSGHGGPDGPGKTPDPGYKPGSSKPPKPSKPLPINPTKQKRK